MFICLLDDLILGFCISNLTRETGVFELASTNSLVLQAKRQTKCASQPLKCASNPKGIKGVLREF